NGQSIIFCATGISDSALLRGVKGQGAKATTHSILMRAKSKSVRFIRATHDLQTKTIRLRSDNREHIILILAPDYADRTDDEIKQSPLSVEFAKSAVQSARQPRFDWCKINNKHLPLMRQIAKT